MTDTTTTAVAAPQSPGAVLAKPLSIKDTVIAQFKEAEAGLQAMADRYRDVVYDVTTTKGMKEAIAARAELRDDGRRMLTRTEKKVKDDVNELKQVMSAEVERLIAIVKPVEDAIDAQIKVEETRKATEKAERERKETERIAAHQANIAQLRGYVARAEGQPLAAIQGAIVALNELTFGEEWEEFAQAAGEARDATVTALQALVKQEEQRIENENLRAQLAALQTPAVVTPESEQYSAQALTQKAQAAIETVAQPTTTAMEAVCEIEPAQAGDGFAVDAWDEHGADADPAPPPVAQPVPSAPPLQPATDDGERISLGQIKTRIAPVSIDAAGLELLGFKHQSTGGAAKLYRACDLPAIRDALVQHLLAIQFAPGA